MGGTSSSTQNQSQWKTPYGPGGDVINGILGNLKGMNPNLTGGETGALNWLGQNGGNQYANQIGGVANNLLAGGGANDQAGGISQAYADYQRRMNPYADGTMNDPSNNPALQKYLDVARNDATNSINSQFAGAGRDLSGMNSQALGRGIGQAEAPILYDAYNQGVNRQFGAANSLYGAGNTTGGLLAGLQQMFNQNQQAGIGAAGSATDARNSGALMQLATEAQRRGIPLSTMQQMMGIAMPSADAFGTSSGSQSGSQTKSWQDQLTGLFGAARGLWAQPGKAGS